MSTHSLHTQHDRSFKANRFVYPVLSRRAGGISLGVNLNPDKVCNFDCIYCQVDRTRQSETRFIETDALLAELDQTLQFVISGKIYQSEKFRDTPAALCRLNDIAFSGDGEPTTYRNFDQLMTDCADVKQRHDKKTEQKGTQLFSPIKMVLITNASMFHRPHVERGLAVLDANAGEIWAKLEAGTEAYYQQIDRTPIPFQQIMDNITAAARVRPLVIQSLFMRVEDQPPSPAELEAFCGRLSDITAAGGQLKLVQIYTIARPPAESFVAPLADAEVNAIVELVRQRTGLDAAGFYGAVITV